MAHPNNSPVGTLEILALCGSLRAESVNLALLQALQKSMPDVTIFGGLHDIPLFNPDHEEQPSPAVLALRRAVRAADALVIACPEYAHGLPGAFKNALDWLVGSAEFDQKPTLVLSALRRSSYAPTQLAEVLRMMGALVLGPDSPDLPSRLPDAQMVLQTPEQLAQFRLWYTQLEAAKRAGKI